MNPALVNTVFEAVGAALSWHSVRLAARTRPTGVSYAAIGWSALWAAQCIPYYLSHDEHMTAAIAGVRCAAMLAWLFVASRQTPA